VTPKASKFVAVTPRVSPAPAPAGVRKSMRNTPFDAHTHAEGEEEGDAECAEAERCLHDAADASAWLLEGGALF
jgi:hypothetical protein